MVKKKKKTFPIPILPRTMKVRVIYFQGMIFLNSPKSLLLVFPTLSPSGRVNRMGCSLKLSRRSNMPVNSSAAAYYSFIVAKVENN